MTSKYIFKYNFFVPIFRLAFIGLFAWALWLIISGVIAKKLPPDTSILGLLFFCSVIMFLLYRILKRLVTESNFIIIDKEKIKVYNFITFKKLVYPVNSCIFFHSYRTPFNSIILKLPTGKYIYLLSYDYFDFNKLEQIFSSHGINKEGFIGDTTL